MGRGGGSRIENLRSPTSFGWDSESFDSESSWGTSLTFDEEDDEENEEEDSN